MGKAFLLLATLLFSPTRAMHPNDAQTRPVKEQRASPAQADAEAREFDFLGFDFKEIYYGYEGPNYAKAAGEPLKGTHAVAEARLFLTPNINAVKFELLDQSGRLIQTLSFVKEDTDITDGDFVGLVSVPAQPFRVAVSAQDSAGNSHRRVYNRLFRPTDGPPVAPRLPQGLPPERAQLYRQALTEHDRQAKARLAEDARENTGGVITLLRAEVSEVTYEPLLSASGNPIGLRLRYAVRVSKEGHYRLAPSAFPLYEATRPRFTIRMEAIEGTVSPLPSETGADDPSDLLRFGGGGRFKAGQLYRFTADLLPDFALRNAARTRFCITPFKLDDPRAAQAAWRTMLARDMPINYRVVIAGTNFTGLIESFHAPTVFHRSLVKDGATACDEHGNINF